MLPQLVGRPIQVRLWRSLGSHLAAASIPRRLILLDSEVLRVRGDFERILVHELFHFVWVRMGNLKRRSWERVLAGELDAAVEGELGWSSESRKNRLAAQARRVRSAAWRRYACESFCDTAAYCFAGLKTHEEFTLPARFRRIRRAWFEREIQGELPV